MRELVHVSASINPQTNVIIFDLPYKFRIEKDHYWMLEALVSNKIICTKGSEHREHLKKNIMHVVVMANWVPDTNEFGKNRLYIMEILQDGSYNEKTVEEAHLIRKTWIDNKRL